MRRPCRECPFRRGAAPGWLGAASGDPVAFLNSFACGELRLPCHLAVDWEQDKPAVQDAPTCAGALAWMRNHHRVPRNTDLAQEVQQASQAPDVFRDVGEFCAHHGPAGLKVVTIGPRVFTLEGDED